MELKSILSLGAAVSSLLVPSELEAQTTHDEGEVQGDYVNEEREVQLYIEHAKEIVRQLRKGLKKCTAEGNKITCASPTSAPMQCTFKEKRNEPGTWPSVKRTTLDCETDGTKLGFGADSGFPVPFDAWPMDVGYREKGEAISEAFEVGVPENIGIWGFPPIYGNRCASISTHGYFNGCTYATKIAAEQVNLAAVRVLNRAARMVRVGTRKK